MAQQGVTGDIGPSTRPSTTQPVSPKTCAGTSGRQKISEPYRRAEPVQAVAHIHDPKEHLPEVTELGVQVVVHFDAREAFGTEQLNARRRLK